MVESGKLGGKARPNRQPLLSRVQGAEERKMNRRDFLKMLGLGSVAASSTYYFDVGANLYRPKPVEPWFEAMPGLCSPRIKY